MSLAASRIIATRALARRAPVKEQKRGFIDYLTNYPDKVRMARLLCGVVDHERNPEIMGIRNKTFVSLFPTVVWLLFLGQRNEEDPMCRRHSSRRKEPHLAEATQ
jgi:hypothetical protein